MSLSRILKGTQQGYGTVTLGPPMAFTISALLQIFGSWRVHELRKSQNQGLRANPAGSMNSRKMEYNPGDFSGFRHLMAATSSFGLKGSGDTVTLRCWDFP